MIKILIISLIIILILYLVCGFIIWGFAIGELKRDEKEEMFKLGLSKAALDYKPFIKNIWMKIFVCGITMLIGPYLLISDYRKGEEIEFPPIKNFRLW